MAGFQWVRKHYFDASILVKLVVDEGGCDSVRQFFNANTNFCTTPLCIAEALGALKRKWLAAEINTDTYFAAIRTLLVDAWGKRVEVDDIGFMNPSVNSEAESLARRHSLDLSDALQLVTILHGRYSVLGPHSASMLLTADDKRARAALSEHIRVWNCRTSKQPPWAV